jgi:hypothetical protein
MEILFVLVPLFIIGVFLVILFAMGKGIAEWIDNNRRPIESVPARVVAKRTETSGNVSGNSGGMVSTWYYATFEFDDGERREFSIRGRDFGQLAERDQGLLTFQGTRFHGFERTT